MALEKQTKTPETEGTRQGAVGNPSASRRKLVKGVFAAPMILTLHSGAAVAATSNTTTMEAVAIPTPPPDPVPTYPADRCILPDPDTLGSTPLGACAGQENSNGYTPCDAGDMPEVASSETGFLTVAECAEQMHSGGIRWLQA